MMRQKSRLSIEEVMKSFGEHSKANDPNVYIQQDRLGHNPIHHPFGLDHYAIIIISSGECTVRVNLETFTLGRDQVLISPPNCIFHFLSIDDNLTFKIISFSSNYVDRMEVYRNHADQFKFLAFKNPSIISMDEMQAAGIAQIVGMLKRHTEAEHVHPFKTEIVLHTLAILTFEIAAALKAQLNIQSHQLSRKEDLVRRFLELAQQHFKSEHKIGFYAEKLAVTANYLAKLTKSESGRSATEIIEDMLVLEANILLRQPGTSVSQVADSLLFTDQFTFSRFFKRKTGQNPSAYKNS
ncbi:MAG: AraC family transcriptional regulator [Pedobacter sp.]|nr:MAG: AraC family transcriptional regulator [Pedobacter sp.]